MLFYRYATATDKKVKWVLSTFNLWREERNKQATMHPKMNITTICEGKDITEFTTDELNFAIARFIKECRNQKGQKYPGNTLREMVLCLQMYLNKHGFVYKFLNDTSFSRIRNCLDNTMKATAAEGIGLERKQADVISQEEEELLWERGILGSDTPLQLLRAVFYLNGIHFALRGGGEHRNLRCYNHPQLTFGVDSDGMQYVQYKEDVSKTNQGGLLHAGVKAKVVRAYANDSNPSKCIVRLHKKYLALCPVSDKDSFYRQELKNPTESAWFSKQAKGVHTLQTMVSDLCEDACLGGYRTNHSLRATAASRLYQKGIDEQLIQEVTGHRSSAVRSYKRTADDQRREISAILGGDGATENQKIVPIASCTGKTSEPIVAGSNVVNEKESNKLNITINVNLA